MRPAKWKDQISCKTDDLSLKFYPVLSSLQLFRVARQLENANEMLISHQVHVIDISFLPQGLHAAREIVSSRLILVLPANHPTF